ncbi:MAG: T9SS type A sorting domain-containing protein [Candidatus Cloacimonetes bacterium]|nr:T9SS type A sorting domain-containing protein [Candidatus Cloacimonadota bacterium]
MRMSVLALLLVALIPFTLNAVLPSCYHSYDEISSILFDLENQHPDIAKVHLIGYSQQDEVPIYAMQISADVQGSWQRPALLFVGQVHAEEIMGVELTLANITEILEHRNQAPYGLWINQLDTWWVPTLNPEGHNVVTANLDTSYRKNKRDNNGNGIFDFSPLVGYDIDGVDINRNFDFNWAHGDTLMQPGGTEVYDYYRGPAPMSESEIQAIKRLADEKKFIYSICWHSSRSGNFSEKVYYSFNWKDVRPSPDLLFAKSIAQGVASQITKENGSATYEFYPNTSRQGCFHDWMYLQYGTFQLLIEMGTSNLQPEEPQMLDTLSRCKQGVWWLLNRALLFSTAVPSSSLLTGNIKDSSTGEAIEAEIIIQGRHAPWFVPRTSDSETGRYFKALPTGTYTVQTRKKGYWDNIGTGVRVNNGSWSYHNPMLSPKEPAIMQGSVRSGSSNINAVMLIKDIQPDTLIIAGDYIHHGYEGEYPIEIFAEGYYPYLGSVTLAPGTQHRTFDLSPAEVLFSEDWESGTDAWEIEGPWVLQNELSASGYAITDSWGGRGHYAQNCDVWIKTVNPIFIPANNSPLLYFDSHLHTEWDFDPVTVEVSTDGTQWTQVFVKSGRHDWWQKEYVHLEDFSGQSIYLRFRLVDQSVDEKLTDPGWTLDNITLITGSTTANEDEIVPGMPQAVLYPNFPNPFNPQTTIKYSLAQAEDVTLEIFNLKGQRVRSYTPGVQKAGNHDFVWNGTDDQAREVASGIYFYRLNSPNYSQSRKMILMK